METEKMPDDNNSIFDKPQNVKRILYLLYGCCVLLFALDFVIHRHAEHSWEHLWGFYPVYGFVGCIALVLIAKWMRTFLMRPENYYEEDKTDINVKHSAEPGGHDVDA